MRLHLVLASAFVMAASACAGRTSSSPATLDRSLVDFPGSRLEVVQEGGFAALSIHRTVSHDTRTYVSSTRKICSANCGAPMDSTSGTLTEGATDSLFAAVLALEPFKLKDDYGITKNGADMFTYVVHLTADGKTKSIKFDDGTMPEAMQKMLLALQTTILAARRSRE